MPKKKKGQHKQKRRLADMDGRNLTLKHVKHREDNMEKTNGNKTRTR